MVAPLFFGASAIAKADAEGGPQFLFPKGDDLEVKFSPSDEERQIGRHVFSKGISFRGVEILFAASSEGEELYFSGDISSLVSDRTYRENEEAALKGERAFKPNSYSDNPSLIAIGKKRNESPNPLQKVIVTNGATAVFFEDLPQVDGAISAETIWEAAYAPASKELVFKQAWYGFLQKWSADNGRETLSCCDRIARHARELAVSNDGRLVAVYGIPIFVGPGEGKKTLFIFRGGNVEGSFSEIPIVTVHKGLV